MRTAYRGTHTDRGDGQKQRRRKSGTKKKGRMDLVAGACRRAAGALWYALTATLYAPVRWAVGSASATPIEADWKVLLPIASPDRDNDGDGHEFRLWWDTLPETSAHMVIDGDNVRDDDVLAGRLHAED